MPTRLPLRLLLLVLAIAGAPHGRRGISFSDDDRSLLLAGSSEVAGATSVLRLPSAAGEDPAPEACEMTYGFLPCTDTAPGNLFLVLAYGLLMFKAATYLSAGSELMLEVLGPGVVGGLFLPILGALPDAMLILGRHHPPVSSNVGRLLVCASIENVSCELIKQIARFSQLRPCPSHPVS